LFHAPKISATPNIWQTELRAGEYGKTFLTEARRKQKQEAAGMNFAKVTFFPRKLLPWEECKNHCFVKENIYIEPQWCIMVHCAPLTETHTNGKTFQIYSGCKPFH
jgi:hypothetical protein